MAEESGRVREGRKHRYVLFEATTSCQNNCLFCYNVWKELDDYPSQMLSKELTLKMLAKVIDEIECAHIGLTGGEPLLRKDIFEIASFIKSRGVSPVLITNGASLTQDNVRKCIDSGIEYFEVSLHSSRREIHDYLVGRKGNYDEVVHGILTIKELGGHVTTVFVATKDNIQTFKETVETNALLGVEWMLFNRVSCGGTCIAKWKEIVPSPDEIRRTLDEAVPVAERYRIGLSAGVQIQPCLVDLESYETVHKSYCPLNDTSSELSYFTIDPGGNLRMCNRSRTILGNLLDESFTSLANSEPVRVFSKAIPDFCMDCKLAHICAGGCKADAISFYGNLKKADPYLELWKERAHKIQ